jgi:dipeptide/tripeptide permease
MPRKAAGRVAGLQNTALNLAGIAAPILTGWLKEVSGSYTVPMQTIGVFLLIGVWAYLYLVRARSSDSSAVAVLSENASTQRMEQGV